MFRRESAGLYLGLVLNRERRFKLPVLYEHYGETQINADSYEEVFVCVDIALSPS